MFTIIEGIEDLKILNKELMDRPYVGLDCEFRRTRKDNMKLCLLQINDGEEVYLIDTLAIKDPKECCSFLNSESVIKIIHSCREDIEAIYSWTNQRMIKIFDTQLAHALLSDNFSISYQGLVQEKLGVVLDKKETRSNWMRRPLLDSQLKYATLDVEYLINLYEEQNSQLINSSKIDWLYEDVNQLIESSINPTSMNIELPRVLSRVEEERLLLNFNNLVKEISTRESVNSTLFFSKKTQKHFLRLALSRGNDIALQEITPWRKKLIIDKLSEILR